MVEIGSEKEWSSKRDRLEQHKYLLDTGFLSDSVMVLGKEKKEVKVHRLLLEMSSPVFRKQFRQAVNNRIVIRDVDPEIFILLIRHVYLGECGAKSEVWFPLLNLASDYKIQELRGSCSKSLIELITIENVTTLFEQAMQFGHADLCKSTLTYLSSNAAEIVKLDVFAELREECLFEILKRDDLRVTDELQIFDAVMRWGEAECGRQKLDWNERKNIRKVLHNVLALIRFPVMEAEEFTLNVATRNVLEDKELISMFSFLNVSSGNRARIPQVRFNVAPRNYLPPVVLGSTLHSAPRLLTGNINSKDGMFLNGTEILEFKSNQAVVLVGLKTFHTSAFKELCCKHSKFHRPEANKLKISVESIASRNFLLRQEKKPFDFFESEMNFNTPLNLEPNSWYSITASISGKWAGKPLSHFSDFNGPNNCESICNVKCEEKGAVQNVDFEFRRGEGNKDIPIEHGLIQELLFKSYFDTKQFYKHGQ